MNCIELLDNPFQGVWIVWFAMLAVIPFGGDATTAGPSERRVQGLHNAHDAHDATCVVS